MEKEIITYISKRLTMTLSLQREFHATEAQTETNKPNNVQCVEYYTWSKYHVKMKGIYSADKKSGSLLSVGLFCDNYITNFFKQKHSNSSMKYKKSKTLLVKINMQELLK